MTGKELQTIFVTGNRIKNYIDNLTNGKGQQWMDKYLGNTAFRKWDEINNQAWPSWALGENTVWITKNSFTPRWITHELAHIWDINTSQAVGLLGAHGGVGDDLNTFVGGRIADYIFNCRYCAGSGKYTIPEDAQYASGYGNNSTADYLAETFTFQIYTTENPGGDIGTKSASSWVQAFIINEASGLP